MIAQILIRTRPSFLSTPFKTRSKSLTHVDQGAASGSWKFVWSFLILNVDSIWRPVGWSLLVYISSSLLLLLMPTGFTGSFVVFGKQVVREAHSFMSFLITSCLSMTEVSDLLSASICDWKHCRQAPRGFWLVLQRIASFFGKPILMAIYWCLDQQDFIYNVVSVRQIKRLYNFCLST